MDDITIIMMTPNRLPKKWAEFHKEKLMEAIGEDTPLITISNEPLDWGLNLRQTEYGYANIYKQMLRGAKLATTKYIGIADDDTLYPKKHFQFRPLEDGFYYNLNRWQLPTWDRRMFYLHKPVPGNCCMIATRELVIKAMELRLSKNPALTGWFVRELGASSGMRKHYNETEFKSFYTSKPIVSLMHDLSVDGYAQKHQKYIWPVRAHDIPVWGRAEEILKKFQ